MPFKNLLTAALPAFIVACSPGPDEQAATGETHNPEPVTTALESGVHLDALDRETRPQDDFYQFANGGWLDSTEIPEIYSGYTVYHEVREEGEVALLKIIDEAASNRLEDGTESQQVGDLYNSWMDLDRLNELGVAAIDYELGMISDVTDVDSLVHAMTELRVLGVGAPFRVSVFPDLKNSSQYAVYIVQSGITLPNRDYYLEKDNEKFEKARSALPAYIEAMLVQSGMPTDVAKSAAPAVFAIEEAIAEIQWDSVRNRDPNAIYNPYPLDKLPELAANIDWQDIQTTLGIHDVDKLVIYQPSFVEGLNQMLGDTPLEDWKNYMTFRIMDSRGTHLDAVTDDIRFNFRSRILRGQQEQQPRWKRGIGLINGVVGEAIGKLYVAEYFPPEAKEKMHELVANVITTLNSNLNDLEWMGPETREKAKIKLSKFSPKIAYPDEWKDYSSLQVVNGDHIGNLRRAATWNHKEDMSKLGGPIDRQEWGMNPQTVNAYYSPTKNEIVFPAARLQPPFFQLTADDAINYGAIGGVIGHEISHGFDDKGSQFDGDGNLSDWWTEADREKFNARTSVLVEQYAQFSPVEGMFVNGELTLGENIGDLSGVSMAYRAYMASLNGEDPPVIDGFTGPQRFFIGYAMSRKGKYQEEALVARIASDTHSPLEFRVNGVYRNMDAFHEAFSTSEGDGMWLPPEERVRIW